MGQAAIIPEDLKAFCRSEHLPQLPASELLDENLNWHQRECLKGYITRHPEESTVESANSSHAANDDRS